MTTVQRELQQTADGISFSLICMIVLDKLFEFLYTRYFQMMLAYPWSGLIKLACTALALIIPIIILGFIQKTRVSKPVRNLQKGVQLRAVLLSFACFGLVWLSDRGMFLLLSLTPLSGSDPVRTVPVDSVWAFVIYLLAAVVVPAILEEYLFRGQVLSLLEKYGQSFSLVVTSLLFALVSFDLVQLPGRFLLGLLLGWMIQRGCSLSLVTLMRLCAGFVGVCYGLSLYGGGYAVAWTVLQIALGLCVLGAAALGVLWIVRRKSAPRTTEPNLLEEHPVYRFFISIPAVALAVAIVFFYVRALTGQGAL